MLPTTNWIWLTELSPLLWQTRVLGLLKWTICEYFCDYLYFASHFTVYTDNNPLTYVQSTAKLNVTGHRWVMELVDFNLGKINQVVDTLSWMPSV